MKGQAGALAYRYARALLDVAADGGPAAAEGLRDELAAIARAIETRADLAAALRHPRMTTTAKRKATAALAEGGGASPLLRRLLDLLASRDRLAMLPALAQAFGVELNARQGVVAATAVAAVPLDESQRKGLTAALAEAAGRPIEVDTREDAALLGGLLVRMDGRTYDGTVRSQLAALRQRLAAGR